MRGNGKVKPTTLQQNTLIKLLIYESIINLYLFFIFIINTVSKGAILLKLMGFILLSSRYFRTYCI